MMSAAQSPTILEARLEALQCHFTWDLDASRSKLLQLRDNLEDIGTEEGYSWLGHIYNLQGYIHYRLGFVRDARRFFSRAAEAFRQIRNTVSDEGPWLEVNYGNLAWLHYNEGEKAASLAYLSKVDALTNEYPSPSQDKLHPEIYAEKAWTMMKFSLHEKLLAAEYFQRAIRMQPDMLEWRTSHVLALVSAHDPFNRELQPDIFEKMKIAQKHDPENLHLAALYLEACAKKGKNVQDEARELARRVLLKPVSSYSGLKPVLRLYRMYVSMDEAIDLAEEVLERHPDQRYLKRCAAFCYKMKIYAHKEALPENSLLDRAVSLCREVIALYPDSSLQIKIDLANIYGNSTEQVQGDQIYEELLESQLEPGDAQMLYNCYAKYAHFIQRELYRSIVYLMKAAEIPLDSFHRRQSISTLQRIKDRNRHPMCGQIEEFLANLQQ